MRVAYLFAETSPNYDLDLKLLRKLNPDDVKGLNTLVRTGLWGLTYGLGGKSPQSVVDRLNNLLFGGRGNIRRINDRLKEALGSENIYTIQFDSLRRNLAWTLADRLEDQERYLGFTQVLPMVPVHQTVFGYCPPRYQIERNKIYVFYSKFADDEDSAERIIKWWDEHLDSLSDSFLKMTITKRNIEERYTVFDAQDEPKKQFAVQRGLQALADEWEVQSERAIYLLQDKAPSALEEILAAVDILSKSELSPAEAAKIAVSLRRTLEHLTRLVAPDAKEGSGWVRKEWANYRDQNKDKLGKYGDLLATEALGTQEAIGKLDTMYQMGNKGVHEDWDPQIFRGILLRLILLAEAVISLNVGHRTVRLNREFFDQILSDE